MQEVYKTVAKFRDFIDRHVITVDNVSYRKLKEDVVESLAQVDGPIDNTDAKLYKIYDTLIGAFAELRLPKGEISDLHRHTYRFFNKVANITSPAKHFMFYPTRLYEEFIKGITVFSNTTSISERPSYHRLESCGTKALDYIAKFKHLPTDKREERKRKLDALKTCIIERKIYDDIYTYLLHRQDSNHMFELQNLERLYLDYTASTIDVNVKYKYGTVQPYIVFVTIHRKGMLVSRISYEKRKNGDVHVEKYEDKPSVVRYSPPMKHARAAAIQNYTQRITTHMSSMRTQPNTV